MLIRRTFAAAFAVAVMMPATSSAFAVPMPAARAMSPDQSLVVDVQMFGRGGGGGGGVGGGGGAIGGGAGAAIGGGGGGNRVFGSGGGGGPRIGGGGGGGGPVIGGGVGGVPRIHHGPRVGGGHLGHGGPKVRHRRGGGVYFGYTTPYYNNDYVYSTSCDWLRRKAVRTDSKYWWRRYRDCVADNE